MMNEKFTFFGDNSGKSRVIQSSPDSDLISLKNVFYDAEKEQYFIYLYSEETASAFTPCYLKKVRRENGVYELDIPQKIRSASSFLKKKNKENIRVELHEETLETVILNIPGLPPSLFHSCMLFGSKNHQAQNTINLVSGTTSWMESLLLNSPALIAGYNNDKTFYENIKRALKEASLPEEKDALNHWIMAQDCMFDARNKTEIQAEAFVQAFASVHKIFMRLLANPDYSMPENFARVLMETAQKQISVSS